ncbi:1442_t:CDS:2, partial [Acaulospora morrowiae]
NAEYHIIPGSSRMDFWNSIANTINERFGTTYTGYQCKNRFQHLVRGHTLMCQYIAGSRTGERYFEEFRSRFWERPETPFDLVHNANTSTRRRHRNRTPTYDEVSSLLSRRESSIGQRDRSASPTRRVLSRRNEVVNRNNANEGQSINSSEIIQRHNDSNNLSSNLTNIPLSQNESDTSVHFKIRNNITCA